MNRFLKAAAVLAGYVAALLVAGAALEVRLLNTQGPEADASSGMYAFGDLLLLLSVFGVAAVVPTGLALYFLRPCRWFWPVLAITALAMAATGAVAASLYVLTAHQTLPRESPLLLASALAVMRMLVAPLLAGVFMLAVFMVPGRRWRWALLAAAGMESAVALYAVLIWFAPWHPL